jgi:hypothetical protein
MRSRAESPRDDRPFTSSDNAPGQDLGFGLDEGRVRDLGRTTKDGSSQRTAAPLRGEAGAVRVS